MSVQEQRNEIAGLLQKHLDNVMELEQEIPGSLKMDEFVKKAKSGCGTVCCMQGWLPATFPEVFKWNLKEGYTKRMAHPHCITEELIYTTEMNQLCGEILGIKRGLWFYLTATGSVFHYTDLDHQYGFLTTNSTSVWVKEIWESIIKDIRAGKLDQYLILY